MEGSLRKPSGRGRIRCDVCITKQEQEELTQDKQRMTEIVQTRAVHNTEAINEDDDRFFTKQVNALRTRLIEHADVYPKRHSHTPEEKLLAEFMSRMRKEKANETFKTFLKKCQDGE